MINEYELKLLEKIKNNHPRITMNKTDSDVIVIQQQFYDRETGELLTPEVVASIAISDLESHKLKVDSDIVNITTTIDKVKPKVKNGKV